MAESICRMCAEPIRYEVRFYADPFREGAYLHARCYEEWADTLRVTPGVQVHVNRRERYDRV